MLDPITTPLILLALGKVAETVITKACEDHLKNKFLKLFGWLEKHGQKDKFEQACKSAFGDAYTFCLEMLLTNIKGCGCSDEELREYGESLKNFIQNPVVADELLSYLKDPFSDVYPRAEVLKREWALLNCRPFPEDLENPWPLVVKAFRRKAKQHSLLSDQLRDILNANNHDRIRELIQLQGGVRPEVNENKYFARMRIKYSPVDLANLLPSYAENPGQMVIRDVFVPQHLRENPPPVEIPKDFYDELRKKGVKDIGDLSDLPNETVRKQLEHLRNSYVHQPPRLAMEVITEPANRLLLLAGEPGSGKSTLMRYLLVGICDVKTPNALPWTKDFNDTFPLLIDLRDFYAQRLEHQCDDFMQ